MLANMNKKWPKYKRPVIYLMATAALVMAVVGGLAQVLTEESPSFSSFMGTFILAAAFQSIFIIALYASLASDHPKIAAFAMFLAFIPWLFLYPENTAIGNLNEEFLVNYPGIGIAYLLSLLLYISAAVLILVNAIRRQRSPATEASQNS